MNEPGADATATLDAPSQLKVPRRRIALMLAGLSALGPFSVDTYFPSFPAIAERFRVTELAVQSTLSLYLLALAGMNLFHGALSDSFGRRRVILLALGVYSLSALACPLAPSFEWLLAFRVVQGLAGGAGMIVCRAIIRDRFQGSDAHKFMAEVTMVSSLAPAIAPVLGGWLHVAFGWRGPFVFLGLLGLGLLLACHLGLQESLSAGARQSFHPAKLARSYWQVMLNPSFLCLSLALSLAGGGFLLYVATAPDVVLNILGLSETRFAWLFVPLVCGFVFGSMLTARLAGRVHSQRLVGWGYGLMAAGAMVNLWCNGVLTPRVPWAVVPLGFYTLGFSLFAPVVTIQCLDLFPERRGLVSSLQGFVQIILFAVISGSVAHLVFRSGLKHAVGMALMLVLSYPAYRLYWGHWKGTAAGPTLQ